MSMLIKVTSSVVLLCADNPSFDLHHSIISSCNSNALNDFETMSSGQFERLVPKTREYRLSLRNAGKFTSNALK